MVQAIKFDRTIADVRHAAERRGWEHGGQGAARGTGYPRLMVTTIDSCQGAPRAYADVVYAYHEEITENFTRLSDEDWAERCSSDARPGDLPWLTSVLAK